ncbi:DUF5131 family protein [Nocardia brasiliensis]|uniref:DUF5131 family protein n=1 Tax=Nocardia brasiliensis TaxID=37326 RepID=UPI002457BECE|nr:phage Gp37/Gp68 family protein [Nocardia brasiliensis]
MTAIEWTEETWNPTTGCTRISEGCDHCYIERTPPMRMAHRRFDGPQIGASTGVLLHPDRLGKPLRWRSPRRVFVNSMSDLFHDDIPDELIARVFAVMASTPRHTFQILTKRAARMRTLLGSKGFCSLVDDAWYSRPAWLSATVPDGREAGHPYDRWPLPNVWLGVSAESQRWADIRIPQLLDTPAAVRWISAEPLLGPVDLAPWLPGECTCGSIPLPLPMHRYGCPALKWRGLDWVVAGGETGPGARPMHPDWARSLRDQCCRGGAAFFFKQWGDWGYQERPEWPLGDAWSRPDRHCWVDRATGETKPFGAFTGTDDLDHALMHRVGKKAAGRHLDRREWDEYPEVSACP